MAEKYGAAPTVRRTRKAVRKAPASQGHPSRGSRTSVGANAAPKTPNTYGRRRVNTRTGKPTQGTGPRPGEFRKGHGYVKPGRKRQQRLGRPSQRQLALARLRDLETSQRETPEVQKSGFLGDVTHAVGRGAIDILDQTTRPAEILAGAEASYLKHRDIFKAVKAGYESGVTRKHRKSGRHVLKQLGVPQGKVRQIGGLGLDLVGDPLTYATAGTAKIAQGAAKGAKAVEGEQKVNRGFTIGVGSKRTSGKTTAAISRKLGIPAIAERASASKVAEGARKVLPLKPRGITDQEWLDLKHASRERRGKVLHETRRSARRARAVRKSLGGAQRRILPERSYAGGPLRIKPRRHQAALAGTSARVRDAIERGDLSGLTVGERKAAEAIIAEQERLFQMRLASGEQATRYRPRTHEQQRLDYAVENMDVSGKRESAIRAAKDRKATTDKRAARQEGATSVRVAASDRRLLRKPAVTAKQRERLRRKLNRAPGGSLVSLENKTAKAAMAEREVQGLKGLRGLRLTEQARRLLTDEQIDAHMARHGRSVVDEPEGYVARQAALEVTEKGARKAAERAGQRLDEPGKVVNQGGVRNPTTTLKDFRRTDRRPMVDVREGSPGKYVEDLETTLRAKAQKDVGRAANTAFRGRVLGMGRKATDDATFDAASEGVYRVEQGRMVEKKGRFVREGDQLVEVPATENVPADAVILKRAIADHANQVMKATGRIPFLDPVTDKIKWVLTIPNPQYWARNLYGGVYNVWKEGAPAGGIARSTAAAARINRQATKNAKAEELLGAKPKGGDRHVLVGPNDEKLTIDEFLDEMERVNVSGGGQTQELLGAPFQRRHKAQSAEDFPRVVAYLHWRREGLPPNDAADRTLRSQFDYGDLTSAERVVARRIFPFWTWRSRNVALQARSLLQRPGRFAAVEKTRDTLANMAGLPENWQDKLTESEALGVPFPSPIRLGNKPVLIFPSLPTTDLNLLTLNPSQLGQQLMGSTHPGAKALVEFWTNYSFFFRDQIEGPGRRYTAAPSKIIDALPAAARQQMIASGILKRGTDRWTGEETWQWRGKADYLTKLIPLTSTLLSAASSAPNRKGQTAAERLFGYGTGLRPVPYTPKMNQLFKFYEDRSKIQQQIEDAYELRTHQYQKGPHKGEQTPAFRGLWAKKSKFDKRIFRLEGELGKKDRSKPAGVGGSSAPASSGGSWTDSYTPNDKPTVRVRPGAWADSYTPGH